MSEQPSDWPPKDYPVRPPGHDLRSEGAPYLAPDCDALTCSTYRPSRPIRAPYQGGTGGNGHALCSCGETSGHLRSANKRKQWHRDHKRAVANASKEAQA
jgi:hypothetical protein